jgi:hypothetical protein
VLNYTKLEAGRVEYRVDAVDLGELLRDVAPMVEPQLAARGLRYEVRAPDGSCLVWADPDKARQVLLNLLSNAAKFTPAGGRVTLDVQAPADAPALMHVRVTDTGIGIPAAQRERIFEPFVQVHAGRTRTADGTGLGLAISRDLAHGMGGELTVASAEGEGSRFTLALRRVRAATGVAVDRRAADDRRVDEERRSGEDRRDDGRSGRRCAAAASGRARQRRRGAARPPQDRAETRATSSPTGSGSSRVTAALNAGLRYRAAKRAISARSAASSAAVAPPARSRSRL